jgi:hypothetical protein
MTLRTIANSTSSFALRRINGENTMLTSCTRWR